MQCIEAARLAPSACNAQPWKFIVVDEPSLKQQVAAAIATDHFCLQATDLGLGTCIIGWFDERKIRKLLNIQKKKRIPLLLTVGYATGELRSKKRKELEVVYSGNGY